MTSISGRKPTKSLRKSSLSLFSWKFAVLIPLLILAIMLITFEKELIRLPVFEQLAATISNPLVFTPMHFFFLLNVLILTIILITQLHDRGAQKSRADHGETRHHGEVTATWAALDRPHLEVGGFADPYSAEAIKLQNDEDKDDNGEPTESLLMTMIKGRISEEFSSNTEDYGREPKGIVSSEEFAITNKTTISAQPTASHVHFQKQESPCCTLDQERPLASTHFTHKKVINRVHPCESPLKISRPSMRKGDTLDATWNAICEEKSRRSSPFRHRAAAASRTRKRDIHATPNVGVVTCTSKESHVAWLSPSKQRHKTPSSSTVGLMRRREPSISRDELNARVESFISNFNQQIKIQRQQSLLHHKRMVDRGVK